MPNVGKSTLFNALTRNNVIAANYPFATIEPNEGVVPLPDPRLATLAEMFASERIVPAPVTFVDIAGLVAGASEGAGLGNKFLANIRECDAICQVVRVFSDDDVTHVAGQVDPKSRESQAVFRCTACGFACHADVNAAKNIAAGHAVIARGGDGVTRPLNREPHLLLQSA